MIILVKLIGIFMVCIGVANILNPNLMKKMISFWRQGKRIYAGGLLRLLFGGIFLLSYSRARIPGVIGVLGIFIFLAGIAIFILGLEKIKAVLGWWDKKPDFILRLIATLILAIGVLVIYAT
jgi:small-conductance mechanosensitive channel